ncbi:hypothetical protein BDN72DRAFT_413422 [Pluteus cervinus]|uniref:Uncharacterized protein n=1 Tax=Pluteus cervinus TaxID=181527 RepID=A0ACD3A7Y6_9AGAR|nr:hypothetical protein BDN72DRAFT_413422 [Pluteus cervinus]
MHIWRFDSTGVRIPTKASYSRLLQINEPPLLFIASFLNILAVPSRQRRDVSQLPLFPRRFFKPFIVNVLTLILWRALRIIEERKRYANSLLSKTSRIHIPYRRSKYRTLWPFFTLSSWWRSSLARFFVLSRSFEAASLSASNSSSVILGTSPLTAGSFKRYSICF